MDEDVAPPWPVRALSGDKRGARAQARECAREFARLRPGEFASTAAVERVLSTGLLPRTGRWAGYRPLRSEASLVPLLEGFAARLVYVRARADRSLAFVAWDGVTPWTPDALRMDAPPETGLVDDGEVTAVLVPGLGFTCRGERLGRGAGCYDRTLARVPGALRVAVTHEGCLFAALPTDAQDLPVDVVVTAVRLHATGARALSGPAAEAAARVHPQRER